MFKKLYWFSALLLVQVVVFMVVVMAVAQKGDPTQFAWLNRFGVQSRSLLRETPRAALDTVKAVGRKVVPHSYPKVGQYLPEGGVVRATGYGAMPAEANSIVQGQLMALDAAQLDAQRNLASTLAGLKLDAQRLADRHELIRYDVSEKVKAHLLGAKTMATRYNEDGSVEVDMEISLVKP